ncbi:MAG: ABC transporter permease [Rhodospirillaceae bacterium]|nr:ABC transporter permease [Rhodospirillaceae bacterium]
MAEGLGNHRPLAPRLRVPRIGPVHWMGVHTLLRRELRRVWKEWPETILAPAFSTLLYIAVFTFALGPDLETEAGRQAFAFILPGLVVITITERAVETPAFSLIFDKLEGSLGDVLMPPLSAAELTGGYAMAGTVAALSTGSVVLAVVALAFGLVPVDPLALAFFAAGGALMMTLVGILIALQSQKWDHAAAFFVFIVVPTTMLSGVFAPIEALPGPVAAVMRLNPIFYVIDGFRAGLTGVHSAPVGLSLAVVTAAIALLSIVCGRLIASGYRIKP